MKGDTLLEKPTCKPKCILGSSAFSSYFLSHRRSCAFSSELFQTLSTSPCSLPPSRSHCHHRLPAASQQSLNGLPFLPSCSPPVSSLLCKLWPMVPSLPCPQVTRGYRGQERGKPFMGAYIPLWSILLLLLWSFQTSHLQLGLQTSQTSPSSWLCRAPTLVLSSTWRSRYLNPPTCLFLAADRYPSDLSLDITSSQKPS